MIPGLPADSAFVQGLPQPADGRPRHTGPMSDLGRDEFLNLLVTQLQNQDPMEPMDNSEFVAQLAQFSSLQELGNANKNLQLLQAYSASLNNSQAVGLIGKSVLVAGNQFEVAAESGPIELGYELPEEDAEAVTLTIKDDTGAVIFTQGLGSQKKGTHSYSWAGVDSEGEKVEPGKYTFEISATTKGQPVEVATRIRARVKGVVFEDGEVYLVIGDGQKVKLADVAEIYEGVVAAQDKEEDEEESEDKEPRRHLLALAGF